MEVDELLSQPRDAMTVRRVFGDPIERSGLTILPVARVRGGAGGGHGRHEAAKGEATDEGTGADTGWGGGWGADAKPAGVYVIRGDEVSWQPAVDVNRIVLGGQVLGGIGLLIVAGIVRRWLRRR